MEGRRGAVVALDPRNGEVLAMVSRPAYDPNQFAGRIRPKDWNEILNEPGQAAAESRHSGAAGSRIDLQAASWRWPVSKPARSTTILRSSAAAAPASTGTFTSAASRGHGTVDLHRAIAQSCDVFFYTAGNKLGSTRSPSTRRWPGLGHEDRHRPARQKPRVSCRPPSGRSAHSAQKWYAGETISVAIGQGALDVSPLQLAHAIGGLAMGGVWHKPHLVQGAEAAVEPHRRVDAQSRSTSRKVIDGMYGVVNEGGTGVPRGFPASTVCGKTGTAQLGLERISKGTARPTRPQERQRLVRRIRAPRKS